MDSWKHDDVSSLQTVKSLILPGVLAYSAIGYTVYKIGCKGACTTPWNHLPLIHIPDEK